MGERRKLEFVVLASILGGLGMLLLGALERTRDAAEESMVQAEATALRVELLDKLAHREVQGGPLPTGSNPVQWAGRAPVPYLGELETAPDARGVWYFDRPAGLLVYRFRRGGEARFRLAVGAKGQSAPATLGGVGLVRLQNDGAIIHAVTRGKSVHD